MSFTIGLERELIGVRERARARLPHAQYASAAGGGAESERPAECVLEAFRTLKFPKPEGDGVVTVTYPIMFSPQ